MTDPKKPDEDGPVIEILVPDFTAAENACSQLTETFKSVAANIDAVTANLAETAASFPRFRYITRQAGNSEPAPAIASAEAPGSSTPTNHDAPMLEAPAPEQPAASQEMLKAERELRLKASQQRWPRIGKNRPVPFAWVHEAADVDHHDAVDWKNGKLPDSSVMSQRIEAILLKQDPPQKPHSH